MGKQSDNHPRTIKRLSTMCLFELGLANVKVTL